MVHLESSSELGSVQQHFTAWDIWTRDMGREWAGCAEHNIHWILYIFCNKRETPADAYDTPNRLDIEK